MTHRARRLKEEDPGAGWRVLVTCEHATPRIPAAYKSLFAGAGKELASHRGHDPGARLLASTLATRVGAPLLTGHASRLLVELNRSLGHPNLWSEYTRPLPAHTKRQILEHYYHPYRNAVIQWIQEHRQQDSPVLHLSVHTFTPVWHGLARTADIGLLYDPARPRERRFCRRWQLQLRQAHPEWRVRRNYPYRGAADGLTTHLRRLFPARHYAGIELEVTQAWARRPGREWQATCRRLAENFAAFFA